MVMATGGGGSDGKGKAKSSLARDLIAAVLLIALGGTAILEVRAISGFNRAFRELEKRLPGEVHGRSVRPIGMPSREEAEKIIGRKPDEPVVKDWAEQGVSYTWRGLVRKHRLTVYYTLDKPQMLVRISTD